MISYVRNRHLFVSDIILLSTAVLLSFVLRLETINLNGYWEGILLFTLLVVPITIATLRLGGMYARYWQYASIEEMGLLVGVIALATLISSGVILLVNGWLMPGVIATPHLTLSPWSGTPTLMTWWIEPGAVLIPRSIPFIYLLLALGFTAAPRMLLRAATLRRRLQGHKYPAKPVLVVGAGHAGTMIVREMQRSPHLGLRVIGFVDNDPAIAHHAGVI